MTDLFVPESLTWDMMGAQPQRGGPLYHIGPPGLVTNEHAAFALGAGQQALDVIMAQAPSKERGLRQQAPLASRPVIQRAVGACDLRLRAARALVREIHEEAWTTVCEGRKPSAQLQAHMRSGAAFATAVAAEVVTCIFRYLGGSALYRSYPLQRCLRDLNAAAQHALVSDVAYELHA